MTFTDDTTYYCVAHSSLSGYKKGCYVCKDDSNIMKWKFNTSSDDDCPSGYSLSSSITAEENCESIIPDSCYVCSNNSNIMKWDNSGDGDGDCLSGYTAKNIPQNECKPIVNPPTGSILMFLVWIVGIGAIIYSMYYYRNIIRNK